MSDGNLLGKAQSLLEALREKGLHLPNPTRVDGDTDALAALAEEVRVLGAEGRVTAAAAFDEEGALRVTVGGPDRARVVTVETRAFAPWRAEPSVRRVAFTGAAEGAFVLEGIERDGPVNVALLDVGGAPLAWCTVMA